MRGKARLAKGFQTRDARHPARQFATHNGLMARPTAWRCPTGGSGTRLYPLIPVDVREVLIIFTPYHLLAFQAVATLGKSDYSRSAAAHVGIIR